MTAPQLWPIFICYRRVDGAATARRLHEMLNKWQTVTPDGQPVQVDAYLDETVPGVADWKGVHRPYLEKARAFLVVCTPGVKLNEGPEDWVHREIDWWIKHRDTAPILVDPLMEGLRYVPAQIAERWPDIQRIALVEQEWASLSGVELEQKTAAVRRHILGALLPTGAEIYAQDLERERDRARRLGRALKLSGTLLVMVAGAGLYAWNRRQAALRSERATTASLLDVRAAGAFSSYRLLEARRELESIRRADILAMLDSARPPKPAEAAAEPDPEQAQDAEGAEEAEPGAPADKAEKAAPRESNLRHELGQLDDDIRQLTAQGWKALTDGREWLAQADAAWKEFGAEARPVTRRSRPEPPYVFSIELLNAGRGESILVHYGSPDDIRLVMINAGPRASYRKLIEPRLRQLASSRGNGGPLPIELFIAGDRDEDKTGGLMGMLAHLADVREAGQGAPLVELRGVWANIFRVDGERENFRSRIRRLIDDLHIPRNRPFDRYVVRPEKGRAAVDLPGGLEVTVLGPAQRWLDKLYQHTGREAEKMGGVLEPLEPEAFSRIALQSSPAPLAPSDADHGANDDCIPSENARSRAGGSYTDQSVANLASTILLFCFRGKTFLHTGDARGDQIQEGLAAAGLMDGRGRPRWTCSRSPTSAATATSPSSSSPACERPGTSFRATAPTATRRSPPWPR